MIAAPFQRRWKTLLSMFDQIDFVLVETSHPGNIGSSARAMKTMGFKNLTLVAPKSFPNAEAEALASGATDLLQEARVVASVEQAVAAADWVVGTSARARAVSIPTLDAREATQQMAARVCAKHGHVAILFGPERTGLTNHCLDLCHQLITIPTSETYASLNLAATVQIVAYELRMAMQEPSMVVEAPQHPRATAAQMADYYQHLEQALVEFDFLDRTNPKLLMRRLRRLYNRAQPDERELNILRGILTAAQSYKKQ